MFLLCGYTIRLFILWTLYLLFDFNRLAVLNEGTDANNWKNAMEISIEIYLDIINLVLEILEAMGDS